MKRIICVLLSITVILGLGACSNGSNADTKKESEEIASQEEVSVPDYMGSENKGEEYKQNENGVLVLESDEPVIHENETIEDYIVWNDLLDNESPLEKLTEKMAISSASTWFMVPWLGITGYNGTSRVEQTLYPNVDSPIRFVRQIREYTQGDFTKKDGYTVYKSELGGYVYIFLKHTVESGYTAALNAVYVPQYMEYKDFSDIKIGDSIDKVIAIDKGAEYVKVNSKKFMFPYSYHLLADGVIYFEYDDNFNITEIFYGEDFIMPNNYLDDPTGDYAYNMTILPQDYPPAN